MSSSYVDDGAIVVPNNPYLARGTTRKREESTNPTEEKYKQDIL
jgi:hypothetical protein